MKQRLADGHVHIGPKFLQRGTWDVEFRAKKMAEKGFGIRAVKSELARIGARKALLIAFPFSEYKIEKANLLISRLVKKSRGRFVGVGVLDIEKEIPPQIEAIKKLGLIGLKVHPMQPTGNSARRMQLFRKMLPTVFKEAQKSGLPLVLHSDFDEALSNLRKFPDTHVILAHSGRGWERLNSSQRLTVLRKFKPFRKVFFDTSTITDVELLKDVLNTMGSERVLFGSDAPYTMETVSFSNKNIQSTNLGSAQFQALTKAMNELGLSAYEKDNILWRNFNNLFVSKG